MASDEIRATAATATADRERSVVVLTVTLPDGVRTILLGPEHAQPLAGQLDAAVKLLRTPGARRPRGQR